MVRFCFLLRSSSSKYLFLSSKTSIVKTVMLVTWYNSSLRLAANCVIEAMTNFRQVRHLWWFIKVCAAFVFRLFPFASTRSYLTFPCRRNSLLCHCIYHSFPRVTVKVIFFSCNATWLEQIQSGPPVKHPTLSSTFAHMLSFILHWNFLLMLPDIPLSRVRFTWIALETLYWRVSN